MTEKKPSFSKKLELSSRPISSISGEVRRRQDEKDEVSAGPWVAEPLPWPAFFASKEHMSFPRMSEKQVEFCAAGLPADAKLTFERQARLYNVLVGLCGKGSGKDMMACLITCFLVYVLLHMRDPYGHVYGASVPGEPIDIVIVAPRGRTSEKVTFEKLRQRILHWKWLRERYRIKNSGREIQGGDRTDIEEDVVEIGKETIIFPGNIRVFALNSSNESAEGFNLLAWIATEYAAFVNSDDRPNAQKIFDTLYTSSNSRFPGKFLGILISYPRYKGDAMMQKYKEAVTQPDKKMFPMLATSWEFNPMLKREDYLAELNDEDPNKAAQARGKYECNPGDKASRFVGLPERILACINKDRPPIAEMEEFEETVNGMRMRRMRIVKFNIPRQPDSRKYVARVDLSKTQDRTSLCVGHVEGDRVIQDLLVHWIPDPKTKLVIDVDDPAAIILQLKAQLINIVYVTYDQWNSASSINRLNRKRITTELLSLGAKEYAVFLNGLYSRSYDLLNFFALVDEEKGELFHLVQDNITGKVDHEDGWHNDLTEAACGVYAMLRGIRKNLEDIGGDISNVKPNLQNVSTEVWADNVPGGDPMEDEDDLFSGEGFSVHLP